tara:strand:- start:3561 stop:4676 length:1116 start_codon:yes stop_codon:yes gene_type:complete
MKIDLIDLKKKYQNEKKELNKVINSVLKKGNLVLTDELENFEKKICKFVNSKFCLGLNSGTDALMMSLLAAGIRKGDEVITSPISFIATIGAIIHIGAKPVFVDVEEGTLNMNPKLIQKAITKKTKAIMPVHWGGNLCDMKKISNIAKKNKLLLIEDAAQAMGAFLKGKHAGTFGHISCFSAHPLKNLNALGDGGFLITNKKKYYNFIKLYRNHGLKGRDNVKIFGVNSRLDSLNAEILSLRLKKLKKMVVLRNINAKFYKSNILTNKISFIKNLSNTSNAYVMFLVLCEKRNQLQSYLKSKGIQSLIYYGKPLHQHYASKILNYKKNSFPIAEQVCKKVLALPIHQFLKKNELKFICKNINDFYENDSSL